VTPKEIREKSLKELELLEKDFKEELFKLKLQDGTGNLEKPHRLKELKVDIARVKTIAREKMGSGRVKGEG